MNWDFTVFNVCFWILIQIAVKITVIYIYIYHITLC
jgi:hypothetical protein